MAKPPPRFAILCSRAPFSEDEIRTLEFYSFVADNYAPFYSRPVECTDRDAPFVLDGVRHVSPIEWKNVILYGEIKIDPAKLTRRGP